MVSVGKYIKILKKKIYYVNNDLAAKYPTVLASQGFGKKSYVRIRCNFRKKINVTELQSPNDNSNLVKCPEEYNRYFVVIYPININGYSPVTANGNILH